MKNCKKAVLFVLDGTLWDSTASVILAWNEVLARYPDTRPVSQEEMKRVMGFSMDQIGDKLFPYLPEARREAILRACELHENEYIRQHGGVLFDGVRPLLEKLHDQYGIGIVSNCQAGYIEAFLEHYGLQDVVDWTRSFGDFRKEKAENIRDVMVENGIEQAVYVGDIANDFLSARQAGVPFVLAGYGFAPFEYEPTARTVADIEARVDEVLQAH